MSTNRVERVLSASGRALLRLLSHRIDRESNESNAAESEAESGPELATPSVHKMYTSLAYLMHF